MSISRHRLRWAALLALAVPLLAVPAPASATSEVAGGTFASPVALPTTVPGSFTATNVGVSSGRNTSTGPYWYNTTWYSYTPSSTGVVSIRATSVSPAGWDNTLEVWTAGGTLVEQRDDRYGLDALVNPTLIAGTSYRIGLGGYRAAYTGTATLSIADQAPDAPTAVTATVGNASATISWTAPADHGSPISSYTIECQQDGGAWSTCASVTGVPPATTRSVTGLVNGSAYRFRVVATNFIGDSAPSDVAPATGSTAVVPTAPSTTTAAAPSSAVRFQDLPVTATVTSGGSPVSGGTVTVSDGVTVLGTGALIGGTAVVQVQPVAGNRTLSVVYGGTTGAATSSSSVPVTITRVPQTVALATLSTASVGTTRAVLATSSAGLPVALSAAGPCTITGTRVTTTAAGSCTITASADGDADRAPALPAVLTFEVVAPLDLTLQVETPLGGLAAGSGVVGRGVGLLPGSPVTLELHSTPQQLATGTAAADGTVSIPASLPTDVEAGQHELVLVGTAPDGSTVRSVLALRISASGRLVQIGSDTAPATPRQDALASTGSPVDVLGGLTVGLLVGGAGLVLAGRRRVRAG